MKNNLKLEEDGDGILRSMKRLINANLPYSTRAPIILCRKHRLSELIVLEKHTLVKHNGERQTLAEVRRNYWIPRGKSFVKHVLLPCRKCKEFNSRPYSYPDTPNLPRLRLRDDVPFSGTGVDYFGPLYCREIFTKNSPMYKCWVVLYTCASTRGVVLDLVHSNHSQTFINSFRRFVARRGCPVTVLSDNGKSFIAENTQSFVATKNVEWKFNIESAPWYGGFWERLVQSVKRCIKKTIAKSKLSYEELQTVLLEIELVLNSRPLCSLFDDDQVEVITPNHLLFGRKLDTINENETTEFNSINRDSLTKRSRYLNIVINHFWQRWRSEYLTTLREQYYRVKKSSPTIPHENDVVLVYDEKQPRQNWKIGRITELITSSDNKVRAAKVKLRNKNIIRRPVNRLYPVEVDTVEYNKNKPNIEAEKAKSDNNIPNKRRANETQTNVEKPLRTKRNAALIADIRRRYLSGDNSA